MKYSNICLNSLTIFLTNGVLSNLHNCGNYCKNVSSSMYFVGI